MPTQLSKRLSGAVRMTIRLTRSSAFSVGDALFQLAVSLGASAVMYLLHILDIPFFLAALAGMLAAMALQTVMALAISPLLGSIESMVPSMVLGMLAPMMVCAAHFAGMRVSMESSLIIAIGAAVLFHLYLRRHGRRCRRRFESGERKD